jgi:hypothetical protein
LTLSSKIFGRSIGKRLEKEPTEQGDGPDTKTIFPHKFGRDLPARLLALGYHPGIVDGTMRPETRAAITTFQQDSGLLVTGDLDEATLKKLDIGDWLITNVTSSLAKEIESSIGAYQKQLRAPSGTVFVIVSREFRSIKDTFAFINEPPASVMVSEIHLQGNFSQSDQRIAWHVTPIGVGMHLNLSSWHLSFWEKS